MFIVTFHDYHPERVKIEQMYLTHELWMAHLEVFHYDRLAGLGYRFWFLFFCFFAGLCPLLPFTNFSVVVR